MIQGDWKRKKGESGNLNSIEMTIEGSTIAMGI